MTSLFENLRSVKQPNLSGAHTSRKTQSFMKNGGQQKCLDKALIYILCLGSANREHSEILWYTKIQKPTANIGPQNVPRTSPLNVPRTSPEDPIWQSRGRPKLKSRGRLHLSSRCRLEMTSWRGPNLASKVRAWKVESGRPLDDLENTLRDDVGLSVGCP